ncbi:hypothetical protein NQ317_014746 [Molorchus minor]|uniref:Uncharacterized protein n=1 Tax=Molorchus minor TaxID=1323400 RepID=A0ABQ9J4D9_9CUCU|nr:hypothetical protein NQ317_014746 [Molorchus minor]
MLPIVGLVLLAAQVSQNWALPSGFYKEPIILAVEDYGGGSGGFLGHSGGDVFGGYGGKHIGGIGGGSLGGGYGGSLGGSHIGELWFE